MGAAHYLPFLRQGYVRQRLRRSGVVGHSGRKDAKILGNADVLFLGNHGVIRAAQTVAQAFDDLYFFERAAQTQYERFEPGYIERHFAAHAY